MNKILLLNTKTFLLGCFLFWTASLSAQDLFFSEYVEGTGNNKCIEIYNPLPYPITLDGVYRIRQYRNGSSAPTTLSNLVGTIQPFDVHVICDKAAPVIPDQRFAAGPTGNDAFTLERNGSEIDIFGGIGCDPGPDGWNVGGNSTKDNTLLRAPCTQQGNTSNDCGFADLGSEWISAGTNNVSNIGSYSGGASEVVISGPSALCENPSITLSATTGFATYQWSNGSRSSTTSVSAGGTYSVVVTNAAGCESSASFFVRGRSPEIFASVGSVRDVSCRPKRDGGFIINASGGDGSGNFTYAWETGTSATGQITGVGAGTYQVTVADANGCTANTEVTVGGIATIPLVKRITPETCLGNKDGTIRLSALTNPSNPLLEYSIDGVNFGPNNFFDELEPGDYPILLRDETGCGDEQRVTINKGTDFDLFNSLVTQAKCQGEGGGQVILLPEGGLSPYEVSFDGAPFLQRQTFSNLKAGTYDILIRDGSGCTKAFEQTIEEGSNMVVDTAIISHATCVGIDDGAVNIEVTGGDRVFFIKRNERGNLIPYRTGTFTDLAIGSHEVIVRDATFDCRVPINFEIMESDPLRTNVETEVTCGNDQNGRITVVPQNGVAPYLYQLDTNSVVMTNSFDSLPLQNYTITTKDNLGCTKIDSIDLLAVEDFNIVFAIPQAPSCADINDGQISVATNRNEGVTYRLEDGFVQSAPVFAGLAAGDYTVFAQFEECLDSVSVTIPKVDSLEIVDIVAQIPLCEGGNDGSWTIETVGGTPPYQYQLDDGDFQLSNVFPNLAQGTYTVTIRDSNYCEVSETELLAGPVRLEPDCSLVQNVSEIGASDGSVNVIIFGGAAPYNVQLVDAGFNNVVSLDGLVTFENLSEGEYIVSVTDKNDCQGTCTFTVAEPDCTFELDASAKNASCYNQKDGAIDLVFNNGKAPYRIEWNNPAWANLSSVENLSVGDYAVTVTDDLGCSDSLLLTITQPDSLRITLQTTADTICEKETALLSLSNNYETYLWTNGAETAIIEVAETSTYGVTVKDSHQCIGRAAIDIYVIPQDTTTELRYTCEPSEVGERIVEEMGIDGCKNTVFRTFELARKDTTRLEATTCEPSEVGVFPTRLTNSFGCDSLVITTVKLLRSDSTFLTETTCSSQEVGRQIVPLVNVVGCDSTLIIETILVENIAQSFSTVTTCDITQVGVDTAFLQTPAGCDSLRITRTVSSISPPTFLTETTCDSSAVRTDSLLLSNQFSCDSLIITNTILLESHQINLQESTCNPQDTGVVEQILTNQFGCDSTVITTTILAESVACQIAFSATSDTLCGDEDFGAIAVTTTFGNPPFSYFLLDELGVDTFQIGQIFENNQSLILMDIPFANYLLRLVNEQGVEQEQMIEMNRHENVLLDALSSDYNGFSVSCEDESDGQIQLEVSGGKSPFKYNWSTGATTENLANLPVGTYEVTATDASNCQTVAAFNLVAPQPLLMEVQVISPNCVGEEFGQILLQNVPNAVGNVGYALEDDTYRPISEFPFSIENLYPDDYILRIRDENSCEVDTDLTITQPFLKRLALEAPADLSLGDSLIIVPQANFDITRYEWTASSEPVCPDCPILQSQPTQNGLYTLTAYDVNDCAISASFNLTVQSNNQVYLPNVFSPNDDGINDVYRLFAGNSVARILHFQIRDFEGRRMYEVNDRLPTDDTVGWDGWFNGQRMLPAVFVVSAEVEMIDGTVREVVQTMTLVK
ncbi:MAG: hypothetical protein AAF960_17225 [Bacteroidota bacterium]